MTEQIPPYSVCASPYGRMFAENGSGWENNPRIQLQRLNDFFDELKVSDSLVFFYVNQGNPLSEDINRIIVGAGRICEKGDQLFFNRGGKQSEFPVWSRRITHSYPEEGVRIPYHEYLEKGIDPRDIVCAVPRIARPHFLYVGEHVSDDAAVAIVERMIHSIDNVRADAAVPGDWDTRQKWLYSVLDELWESRGNYPGLGSVLTYLGHRAGVLYHRAVLLPLEKEGKDVLQHAVDVLDGKSDTGGPRFSEGLDRARSRWVSLSQQRRDVLKALARFEVSTDQVDRVCSSVKRTEAGISASDAEVVANPYLLAEQDSGEEESEPIDFETIDHGVVRPSGSSPRDDGTSVDLRDSRRVRALLTALLQEAATDGDTFLSTSTLLSRAAHALPRGRECLPEVDDLIAAREYYCKVLSFWPEQSESGQLLAVALQDMRQMEKEIEERVRKLARKTYDASGVPWRELVDSELRDTAKLDLEVEGRIRAEKVLALQRAFGSRISLVTGRAGTGKTTLVKILLKGIESREGRTSTLLLAPTGKARIRLQEKSGHPALTIHQFLASQGWLQGERYRLLRSGGSQKGAQTVVLDEASMVSLDVLATLFRSLDFNEVRRLVLIGDPNQLPPIGPGRPFLDIITWMEKEGLEDRVCRLTERARFEDRQSQALRLSDAFVRETAGPNDDEILAMAARRITGGDLEVHFWDTVDDLNHMLFERLGAVLELGEDQVAGFNKSLGIKGEPGVAADSWQILSPLRGQPFGILETNRRVQSAFRSGLILKAKRDGPKPFGDQRLVIYDKVIQLINQRRKAREDGAPADGYVANGEVGIITNTSKKYDFFQVTFSSQPELNYEYFRSRDDLKSVELAYAITVHKAQGSDFGTVFFIIPQKAATLSRELLYTGLTRFRKRLVLLIERDIAPLLLCRRAESSSVLLRNTHLFELTARPETVELPHPERLIHRTAAGVMVRSKSEVIVANALTKHGLSYHYEEPLRSLSDPRDFRLPDFTVMHEGETFYWEHLGMLSNATYRAEWERKRTWYESNGFSARLITSEDGPDGSIDSEKIDQTILKRIIG